MRGLRRDKIGQAPVGRAVGLLDLLAEEMEPCQDGAARVVRVKLHVVAKRIRGEETIDGSGPEQLLADDFIQQLLRVGEKLPGLFAVPSVLEYGWVTATQLPGVEKR